MIEQLKTIRSGIEKAHIIGGQDGIDKALTALTQLEAMVGAQEPVAWRAVLDPEQAPQQLKTTMHVVGFREKKAAEGFAAEQIDFYGWRYTIEPLYAAPVAQQYEAGDMASAAAQGFRDGVASVTQQEPVDLIVRNCCEAEKADPDHPDTICISVQDLTAILEQHAAPVAQQPTFDARRALEAIEALLSNIRRDAPSLSGKVMGFAEEVAAALRDKVARQPQARPDFTDEWTGYLKDGETPFERFLRERKDVQSALKLYQRALEENERLKAQQPQAECAMCGGMGYIDGIGNRCGLCDGMGRQPQAEDVEVPNTFKLPGESDDQWLDRITGAAPQQAEAVPLPPQVMVDMVPPATARDRWMYEQGRLAERDPRTHAAPQQAEAVPIGVVVAIDASDQENGPDAIVALHRDVALGAKLYDQPPSRSTEIAELKESLRISLENYETQRKAAGQARAAMYDIHYALKDAGWHPGRTDDKLTDIIRAKGERMRELEAEPGIRLTPEEIEALRHTMSAAVLFSRAKNTSDIRSSVLTRFDQFFEYVKDHVRPHQPDPEAVGEGLAQIIFEAINPGKVWTYQSTDVRNTYWQAGQAAKEFLK